MLGVVRLKLDLTRPAAAELLGVPVATLRDWEERRAEPDGPARALIRLLYDHPHQIRDWLTAA